MTGDVVQKPQRIDALEGLRGIASAVVVVRHVFNSLDMPLDLRQKLSQILAPLINAQGAVQLFFVLSGYVLARSLSRGQGWLDLGQFYVKRVFRIYPPYVVAVLFAWCASFYYATPPDATPQEGTGLSAWFAEYAQVHLRPGQLLLSLGFPGSAFRQVPAGWTLTIEMAFSFALPLLFAISRRFHWSVVVIACAVALAAGVGAPLHYAMDFCLGIAIFLERERIGRWMKLIPVWLSPIAILGALAVFSAPQLLNWSIPRADILICGFDPASIGVMGIGSLGLISGAMFVPWLNRFLSVKPLMFLGRISFSLYLLHFPVLILFAPLVSPPLDLGDGLTLLAAVLAISILISAFFFRWVERPSIRAGKLTCTWLSRRFG